METTDNRINEWIAIALEQVRSGCYEQQLQTLGEALKIATDNQLKAEILENMGNTLLMYLKRFHEAERMFEQAAQLYPDKKDIAEMEFNRGICLGQLQLYDEEIKAYERSYELFVENRDKAGAFEAIGGTFVDMRQPAKALEAYDRALQLAGDDKATKYRLIKAKGNLLNQMGECLQAIRNYDSFLTIYPGFGLSNEIRQERKRILKQLNRFDLEEYNRNRTFWQKLKDRF